MAGQIDSWQIERDGITYRVDIDPDYESNQGDPRGNDDGMREETAEAHQRGEWEYVGVTVTALVAGTDYTGDYPTASASLWGVEYGTLPATSAEGIPGDDPRYGPDSAAVEIGRGEIENYPVPDLISEVRGELAKLRDHLNALDLTT